MIILHRVVEGQIYCGGKYRRTYRSKLTIAAVNQYI